MEVAFLMVDGYLPSEGQHLTQLISDSFNQSIEGAKLGVFFGSLNAIRLIYAAAKEPDTEQGDQYALNSGKYFFSAIAIGACGGIIYEVAKAILK